MTRLNTAESQAQTARRAAVDERETETLKRLPRAGGGADGRAMLVVSPSLTSPASPTSRRRRISKPVAAAAAAFAAVAALGAWSALAGALFVDDDASMKPSSTPSQTSSPTPATSLTVATSPSREDAPAIVAGSAGGVEMEAPPSTPSTASTPSAPAIVAHPASSGSRIAPSVAARSKKPIASARAELEPGTLVVDSRPWSAVSIDGVDVGVTPIAPREVRPGVHSIVFANDAQDLRKTITVVVKSGRVTTARVDLRR
jgi:hypothetical protein